MHHLRALVQDDLLVNQVLRLKPIKDGYHEFVIVGIVVGKKAWVNLAAEVPEIEVPPISVDKWVIQKLHDLFLLRHVQLVVELDIHKMSQTQVHVVLPSVKEELPDSFLILLLQRPVSVKLSECKNKLVKLVLVAYWFLIVLNSL